MNVNANDAEYDLPEIIFFRASDAIVEKREAFSLYWEVKNAVTIEIFKNGISFLKPNAEERSVTVKETYDGKDKEVKYSLTAVNDFGQIQSLPVSVRITDVVSSHNSFPEIIFFKTNVSAIRNKEPFTLSWEVKNATHVDLYRNGLVFRKYNADKTSATISESYDGRDKDIIYTLLASNNKDKIESAPLSVAITEKIIPVTKNIIPLHEEDTPSAVEKKQENEEKGNHVNVENEEKEVVEETRNQVPYADEETPLIQKRYQEGKQKNLRNIRLYLWGILIIILLALFGVIFYFQSKPKILDFDPKSAAEEHSIVIVGKNFPADSNKFQILFNKKKGNVEYNSKEIIRVVIPPLGEQKTNDSANVDVEIVMVYKGDTIHASKNLLVVPKLKERGKENTSTSFINQVPVTDSPILEKPKKVNKTAARHKDIVVNQTGEKVDSQPTEKKEESLKQVNIDIYKSVHASPGDYNKRLLGGVKGLKVTVVNDSPYDLDKVTVTISYLKNNEREVKKELMLFTNVRAHSSSILDGSRTNRGSKVTCSVTSVSSKQLDADLNR